MKIALCVGHNIISQGARGSNKMSEYSFNQKFLEELIKILPEKHTYKIFYRPASKSYNTQQKVLHAAITSWGGCELALEFHFNSADSASGHEILYATLKGEFYALKLNTLFTKYLDTPNRGIIKTTKENRGAGFLFRGKYPCLIIEPFFGDEIIYFLSEEGNKKLCKAYIEFFEGL